MRFVLYLIFFIVLISVVRTVAGFVLKGVALWFGSSLPSQQRGAPSAPLVGELKKDPVCGTFVSTATSVKKNFAAGVVHFCSTECRDKFRA